MASARVMRDGPGTRGRRRGDRRLHAALACLRPQHRCEKTPQLVEQVRDMMAATPVAGILGALGAMRDRPDSTPLLLELAEGFPPSSSSAKTIR